MLYSVVCIGHAMHEGQRQRGGKVDGIQITVTAGTLYVWPYVRTVKLLTCSSIRTFMQHR